MDIERRDWEFGSDDDALVVESRADGRSVIRGYAVVYNRLSVDLGGFRERILPGAFDGVFNRQRGRADLVSYYNHNPDILLGRESSGTLKVWTDEKGVGFEVVPPASRADILELVARRDVKGASFTFSIEKNGETFTTDENGRAIREVRAATIYELGPVVQPAYPSTSVSVAMRSYQLWLASQATPEPTPHVVSPDIGARRLAFAPAPAISAASTSRCGTSSAVAATSRRRPSFQQNRSSGGPLYRTNKNADCGLVAP